MKFKIGDIVKIRRDSEFWWQSASKGKIISYDGEEWYRVKFEDGKSNSYRNYDLELVEKRVKTIKQYGIVAFMKGV